MSESQLPEKYDPKTLLGKALVDLDKVKLPEMIEKNLIRSACRLITGMADIPVAYLKSIERNISRETEALDIISKANAEDIAKFNAQNSEFIEQTASYYSLQQFQKSKNRRKVMQMVVDEFSTEPPSTDTNSEIDDLWLNKFSKIAEDINAIDLQLILSKILKGEINQPGKFSLSTLNILENMDSQVAKDLMDFTSVALWQDESISEYKHRWVVVPSFDVNQTMFGGMAEFDVLREYVRLVDLGLVRNNTYDQSLSKPILLNGCCLGNTNLVFEEAHSFVDNQFITFKSYSLTTAGSELFFLCEKAPPSDDTIDTYRRWISELFELTINHDI